VTAEFRPFSDLERPDKRRRNLPHWDTPGATYFVTFRLADALPAGELKKLEIACAAWLRAYGISHRRQVRLLPDGAQHEFRRLFTAPEERWLDAGQGACVLRDPQCREAVIEMMLLFDATRYALDEFVIMPNHVHALMLPLGGNELLDILATWKKFSARQINGLRKRSGTLWQAESFDHIVRDRERLEKFRDYIRQNPVKARLREGEYTLGNGSGIL
jgi:putative transposase